MSLNRREFLHVMSMAAAAGMLPGASYANSAQKSAQQTRPLSMDLYQAPMKGKVRLLHLTDTRTTQTHLFS